MRRTTRRTFMHTHTHIRRSEIAVRCCSLLQLRRLLLFYATQQTQRTHTHSCERLIRDAWSLLRRDTHTDTLHVFSVHPHTLHLHNTCIYEIDEEENDLLGAGAMSFWFSAFTRKDILKIQVNLPGTNCTKKLINISSALVRYSEISLYQCNEPRCLIVLERASRLGVNFGPVVCVCAVQH